MATFINSIDGTPYGIQLTEDGRVFKTVADDHGSVSAEQIGKLGRLPSAQSTSRRDPTRSGSYDPVECPMCGVVDVPHATVGQECPAVVQKRREIQKNIVAARRGDGDSLVALIKTLGADKAADLINPNLGGIQ